MLSVDMSSLWGSDNEQIVKGVLEATENIASYRSSSNTSIRALHNLFEDIIEIGKFWTSNTYVGQPKDLAVKAVFQSFFEALMDLLLNMKNTGKKSERAIAEKLLYRGKVYRYLGNAYPSDDPDDIVKPVFDDIYVSWSKEPQNGYIRSKLYGPVTLLSCEISTPFYGIDLDELNCSRGNEHEVVFPTTKKCIIEIEYISVENDD